MELGSSDDCADIAQEGSDTHSVSSAELPCNADLDGLDDHVQLAEMCGSSDTDACPSRTESDMSDNMGMQLGSTSDEGGSSPCDRDGMVLDSSGSDQEAEAAVKPAGGWRPGKDCGSFDGFGTPLVQVILANLYLNARRLGSVLCKSLLRRLLPKGASIPTRNFTDRIVAQMSGVSNSRGRRVHDQVRDNGWAPCDAQDHLDESSDAEPAFQFSQGCTDKEERSLWAMRVRVEEALHVSRKGRPDTDYSDAMERLQSHGLVLGEKYRSHHFAELVERHCVAALNALTAQSLNRLVPSLGIPADLVTVFYYMMGGWGEGVTGHANDIPLASEGGGWSPGGTQGQVHLKLCGTFPISYAAHNSPQANLHLHEWEGGGGEVPCK